MRMPMTSVRPHANAKMGRTSLSLALLAGTAFGGLACLYASNARADEQLASFLPVGQIAAVDLSNDLTSDAVSCLGGPSLNTCLVNVANQAHASGAGIVASLTNGGGQPPASGGDPGTQGSAAGRAAAPVVVPVAVTRSSAAVSAPATIPAMAASLAPARLPAAIPAMAGSLAPAWLWRQQRQWRLDRRQRRLRCNSSGNGGLVGGSAGSGDNSGNGGLVGASAVSGAGSGNGGLVGGAALRATTAAMAG